MIVGDHIVTTAIIVNGVAQRACVTAIDKERLHWRWAGHGGIPFKGHMYVRGSAVVTGLMLDTDGSIYGCVRRRDRGVTWAPAQYEDEVKRIEVIGAIEIGAVEIG